MAPTPCDTKVPADPPAQRQVPTGIRGFFGRRWRGDVPLGDAFWRDMVLFGSAINLAATLAAVLVLAAKGPVAAVIAFYALPVPVNIFVFVEVLRASKNAAPNVALAAQIGALAWFVLAIAF